MGQKEKSMGERECDLYSTRILKQYNCVFFVHMLQVQTR